LIEVILRCGTETLGEEGRGGRDQNFLVSSFDLFSKKFQAVQELREAKLMRREVDEWCRTYLLSHLSLTEDFLLESVAVECRSGNQTWVWFAEHSA
jgi:hypothetical protein